MKSWPKAVRIGSAREAGLHHNSPTTKDINPNKACDKYQLFFLTNINGRTVSLGIALLFFYLTQNLKKYKTHGS
jgi:hypothetical protein